MKTVAISLALGDIFQETGRGPLVEPLDGAIARFKGVLKKAPPESSLVVCTAGYSKEEPLRPQPERSASLAEQLSYFIDEYCHAFRHMVALKALCWSTRNEVRLGIKLAMHEGFAAKDEKVRLVIASNATHLPRIILYALFYKPHKWKFRPVWVRHQFSLMSHLYEPAKLVRDVVYMLRVLARLKRLKKS